MATITKGKTFVNGELVTPEKIHQLVDSATVTNIVNADIAAGAAIADTKLAQISTAGKVLPAAVQGTAVITSDSRLSDARPPTTHNHDDRYYTETEMNNLLAGKQASGSYAPATGIAATAITGTAVITTDSRLSDARTPTSHTHDDRYYTETEMNNLLAGKQASGSYAPATGIAATAITGTAVITTDPRLSDARTPTSHTHGNLTNAGAIGATANLPVVTTTSGVLTTIPAGSAGQVLTSNGGTSAPSFQTLAATSTNANNLTGGSAGTVPYQSAAGTTAMLAAGTSGQVLRSNGAAAPSWLTLATSATTDTTNAGNITTGTLAIARIPTGATGTTVCVGNDSRLSDARTPTSHTHAATDITSGTLANARTTATNANTANAIVARDASGNFSAGTITAGTINATSTLTGGGLRVRWPDENSNAASGFEQNLSIGHTLKINCGRNALAGREFINFVRVNSSGDTTILGTITAQGSPSLNSVAYNTTSDYRLKTNIEPLTAAVARLLQIPVHRFHFIGGEAGQKVDGFLAHEAQAVVPESVTGTKDEVDADGKPIHQGIDQSKLVPLLVAAVQELAARVAALEAK